MAGLRMPGTGAATGMHSMGAAQHGHEGDALARAPDLPAVRMVVGLVDVHAVARRRLAFAGSLLVVAAGTFWFIERVFFPAGIT